MTTDNSIAVQPNKRDTFTDGQPKINYLPSLLIPPSLQLFLSHHSNYFLYSTYPAEITSFT